jgi:hypothetical protein
MSCDRIRYCARRTTFETVSPEHKAVVAYTGRLCAMICCPPQRDGRCRLRVPHAPVKPTASNSLRASVWHQTGQCERACIYIAAFASLAAIVWTTEQQAKHWTDFSWFDVEWPPHSTGYYVCYSAQLAFALCAGIHALLRARDNGIPRRYVLWLIALVIVGLEISIRTYTLNNWFSTLIVWPTGPLSCVISLLILVGAGRNSGRWLAPFMAHLAVASSVVALVRMAEIQTAERWEAVVVLTPILNVLFWPAAFLVLQHGTARRTSITRLLPILVYIVGSIYTQTRLNFVMLAGLLGLHAFIIIRRGGRLLPFYTAMLFTASLAIGLAVFVGGRVVRNVTASVTAFHGRLDDDTRTGQLKDFIRDFRPTEVFFGRGALATWKWAGMNWQWGTDVGYLSLIFFGGIPLLTSYFVVHIRPGTVFFTRNCPALTQACAGVVVLFAIRMLSSTYPSLSVEYYPVLLCVGFCVRCNNDATSMSGMLSNGTDATSVRVPILRGQPTCSESRRDC